MDKQMHSTASDVLRRFMIQNAMRKAAELAQDNFYYGLGIADVGNKELAYFAEEAWRIYTLTISFDYPHYAHALFVRAYQTAYHLYEGELPRGLHPNLPVMVAEFETEMGLALEPDQPYQALPEVLGR